MGPGCADATSVRLAPPYISPRLAPGGDFHSRNWHMRLARLLLLLLGFSAQAETVLPGKIVKIADVVTVSEAGLGDL